MSSSTNSTIPLYVNHTTSYRSISDDRPERWIGGRRPEKRRRDTLVGYFLLIISLAAFTAQTELTNILQARRDYRKPYFILWVAHSTLLILLPIQLLIEWSSFGSLDRYYDRMHRALSHLTYRPLSPSPTAREQCLYLIWLTFKLSILLGLGAYLWYVAAGLTSSATLTAIYNSSCCFVYLFSVLFIRESVTWPKALAVVVSLLGVVYMSMADQSSDPTQSDTFVGDLVALGSAVSVGLYEVYYRHVAVPQRHNSAHFVNTVVGMIGLCTLFTAWLPIPFLHYAGWETFEMPDLETAGWILAISLCGVCYHMCLTPVIALISPLFASIGIMLTIPVVAITDWLLQGQVITIPTTLGSLGILIGFAILAIAHWKEESKRLATILLLD
jgi:drug/metabolite transporter (DMT)-like permease